MQNRMQHPTSLLSYSLLNIYNPCFLRSRPPRLLRTFTRHLSARCFAFAQPQLPLLARRCRHHLASVCSVDSRGGAHAAAAPPLQFSTTRRLNVCLRERVKQHDGRFNSATQPSHVQRLAPLLPPPPSAASHLRSHILAMAARSACQSSSLLNSITQLPCVPFPTSSTNVSFGSSCRANHLPLHVTASASDSRKAMKVDGTVCTDRTVRFNINRTARHRAPSSVPAAAPISVVATEVETLPLDRLKTGYLKFKENYIKNQALVKSLAETQTPPYMIIACADSRVDPCTVLSLGPGEAFVLRNIGNMVPPYTGNSCSSAASAIEYALLHLKVKHLVVIGHSRCGAIKALMGIEEDGSNRFSEFIEDWILISKTASKKVKSLHQSAELTDQCTKCKKENVNNALWNCLSYPFVREKMSSGELTLHGGYYDFVNNAFESWSVDLASMSKVEKVH
ncbi:hypothetical protein L7F22_024902 [Adiantum nelumboides]|nr:hypothetical protein [Adiantum nelumboides]